MRCLNQCTLSGKPDHVIFLCYLCEHISEIVEQIKYFINTVYVIVVIFQATKDLENYDAERHEEFKRYEMLKEHERREYLKSLDQEKREKEERRIAELKEKHRQHPKVNAPVRESL